MGKLVVVFRGSPRRDSSSMKLCNKLLELADEDCEIKIFNAYEMNALPCIACGYCETHNGCAFHDLDEMIDYYERADYVVMATPIYYSGIPAPLKAIIDRSQRYYNKRFVMNINPPIAKPKRAVLIATAGQKGSGFEMVKKMIERQYTIINTKLVDTVFIDSMDSRQLGSCEFAAATSAGYELFK